jgi:hypothetical protein
MAGIERARDLAMEHARLAYSGAFSAALLVAAVIAGFSKVHVGVLMREVVPGRTEQKRWPRRIRSAVIGGQRIPHRGREDDM